MADTANYGWTKPTVGGDNGAWGTKVNAALDAIDASLKAVADAATGGSGATTAVRLRSGGEFRFGQKTGVAAAAATYGGVQASFADGDAGVQSVYLPLPEVREGQTITQYAVRTTGGGTGLALSASLLALDENGLATTISTMSVPTSGAAATTTSPVFSHAALAARSYVIEVQIDRLSAGVFTGAANASVLSAQLTVTA